MGGAGQNNCLSKQSKQQSGDWRSWLNNEVLEGEQIGVVGFFFFFFAFIENDETLESFCSSFPAALFVHRYANLCKSMQIEDPLCSVPWTLAGKLSSISLRAPCCSSSLSSRPHVPHLRSWGEAAAQCYHSKLCWHDKKSGGCLSKADTVLREALSLCWGWRSLALEHHILTDIILTK